MDATIQTRWIATYLPFCFLPVLGVNCMKILESKLKKKTGSLTLKVETLDDLWHLMNIIFPGDRIFARTMRRIRISGKDGTVSKGERRPVFLGITVEKIGLHKFTNTLRLTGRIIYSSDENIPLGDYHTIAIQTGTQLTIEKDYWPEFILERIQKAVKATNLPPTLFISVDEGESCFLLATQYELIELVKIDVNIPGKRYMPKEHDESMKQFLKETLKTLFSKLKEHKPNNIIIVGPGFVKNHFHTLVLESKNPLLKDVNIRVLNSSVGCYNGIYEVIRGGELGKIIEELQVLKENTLIEEALSHLGRDDGLVAYGLDEVEKLVNYGAVEKLLILDKLLREIDSPEQRTRLESLLSNVEKYRGEIIIVNSEHTAGEQLASLGGILAFLRYKVPKA